MLEGKYQTHVVNKTVARDIKANEKLLSLNNSQSIACFALDLQKVLNVPFDESGLLYYTHKFAVYNLTITDLINKDGFYYTWDQTTAKWGSQWNWQLHILSFHVSEFLKDRQCITWFSDNCPGMNKNRYIYQMMSLLTLKMQKSKEIQLIFLEKEHIQNVNDSKHSTTERPKRRINIYQWEAVMQCSCNSKP